MKTDPTLWLLARASGLTAYVLLSAAVVAGLVLKSRPFGRALRPGAVTDVHRFLTFLALGMVGLHGLTLVLDRTLHMPPAALVVPGIYPYRPAAVGLGVLACELAVLVALSFPLRRRIGFRAWRRLHWATYLVFLLATAHGVAAGTDSAGPWATNLYFAALGAVTFATAWRTFSRPIRTPERSI